MGKWSDVTVINSILLDETVVIDMKCGSAVGSRRISSCCGSRSSSSAKNYECSDDGQPAACARFAGLFSGKFITAGSDVVTQNERPHIRQNDKDDQFVRDSVASTDLDLIPLPKWPQHAGEGRWITTHPAKDQKYCHLRNLTLR